MLYFSHRGANTLRVQNTLPAFALAHAQGARSFELDVHLLKDGTLAIHHDYSLLHTAGQNIVLKDLTSTDLKKHPLINPFGTQPAYIPLFSEVLPVLLPGLEILNIELKNDGNLYPGIEEAVLKFIPPRLLPNLLFSSFDYPTLQRLRALCPQAKLGQLTRAFNVQEALALGAKSVHLNHIRFSPQIAQICHQNSLEVYCYTVNEKPLAARLADQGVDGIFTDKISDFLS